MSHSEPMVLFRRVPGAVRRAGLEEFACRLRRYLTRGRVFSCLIADDRELARLNRQFLGKDYATDVLSFPAKRGQAGRKATGTAPQIPGLPTLGDIAISRDRAVSQAREFGHPVNEEIRILMLHGVLHLLGMDHERDGGAMARAEAEWRSRLGLRNGLIERARS